MPQFANIVGHIYFNCSRNFFVTYYGVNMLDTLKEHWFPIENFNYDVSDLGKIRNNWDHTVLKPSFDGNGYLKVSIAALDTRKVMTEKIHRLVAETLILNPNNLPQVNHKDGDKTNNKKTNLEWVTQTVNINHGYDTGLYSEAIATNVTDMSTGIVTRYRSIAQVALFLDMRPVILIPYIKNSLKNPLHGKYVLKIEDEVSLMNVNHNSDRCSLIHIFDIVAGKLTTYPNAYVASYFTGLKLLAGLKFEKDCIYKVGYYASFDINSIPAEKELDTDKALSERNLYLNVPYKKYSDEYHVYNYYSKETLAFDSLASVSDYLSVADNDGRLITKTAVSVAINRAQNINVTSLIKGYGVKTKEDIRKWFPYTEEDIINSKNLRMGRGHVYRVFSPEGITIALGIQHLGRILDCPSWKVSGRSSIEELLCLSRRSNIQVKRLNIPV